MLYKETLKSCNVYKYCRKDQVMERRRHLIFDLYFLLNFKALLKHTKTFLGKENIRVLGRTVKII